MRSNIRDPHTFDAELFARIVNSKNRIASESRREAWIADTILLLASRLGNDAVLSGGSAVRNITHVMRTTYDLDFDTRLGSLKEIRRKLMDVNRAIGIKSAESAEIGALLENSRRNVEKTFYGMRKMLHMLRRTDQGNLRVHVMHVKEMPEMFVAPPRVDLVSIEETNRHVLNARPEHLFFRKALRANKERRVEDFLDIYNLLHTTGASGRNRIIAYVKSKNATAVAKGIRILAAEPEYFKTGLPLRLVYVEADLSPANMKAVAHRIAGELHETANQISD